MGTTSKSFSLILVATLAISSLIMAQSSIVQATPKPQVPKFTLKYVENSYDVPATYGIDPYTGKTVIVQQGGHSESRHIEVTIKNQQFTPYSENGSTIGVLYQMQIKGHYAGDKEWRLHSFDSKVSPPTAGYYYSQSDAEETVISVPVENYDVGSEIDFQVRTLIGHTIVGRDGPGFSYWCTFYGETGEWSSTQTIKIEGNATAETPDTVWPFQDNFPSNQSTHITYTIGVDYSQIGTLVLLAVIAVLLAVIAVLLYRRNPKQTPPPPNTYA